MRDSEARPVVAQFNALELTLADVRAELTALRRKHEALVEAVRAAERACQQAVCLEEDEYVVAVHDILRAALEGEPSAEREQNALDKDLWKRAAERFAQERDRYKDQLSCLHDAATTVLLRLDDDTPAHFLLADAETLRDALDATKRGGG